MNCDISGAVNREFARCAASAHLLRSAACAGFGESERRESLPLFMDIHTIEGGVAAADVAAAHTRDLATQSRHGVSYLRYWVDEAAGKVFCLVEAETVEEADTVHREAHGLAADEIYTVSEHH